MMICSDFDGTLFMGDRISDENVEAIRYFQENGGRFTITSGRYPAFLGKHRNRVEANTYLIGLNGTIISNYEGTDILRQGFLKPESSEVVKTILREVKGIECMDFSPSEIPERIKQSCKAPEGEGFFRFVLGKHDDELLELALSCHNHRIIFHTIDPASDEITNAIREIAGEAHAISRSFSHGIEIQDAAFTKGTCARYLANHIGAKTLICVGDYENDISMVREADIGCAVGNAIPALKAVADRLLPSVDQSPFVTLIDSLG